MRMYFFFSSRRRHTRFSRDWSSDVCSSDLRFVELAQEINATMPTYVVRRAQDILNQDAKALRGSRVLVLGRSEERRVGKERRSWRSTQQYKDKIRIGCCDTHHSHVPR